MMTTRSAISATTPMSWVMRMMAVPVCFCRSLISSRICAWMVQSRAVVGSSAIRILGSHDIAIAIITRWRMPPDSSCGNCFMRRRASGMRTESSTAMARFSASASPRPLCRRSPSTICVPMLSTGLRLVIGSWKIMAMSSPRMSCISGSDSLNRSRPWKIAVPAVMRPPGLGRRPINESAVTDLPDPDSPAMHKVSPALRVKLRPSTTVNAPLGVANATRRLSRARRGVERVLSTAAITHTNPCPLQPSSRP